MAMSKKDFVAVAAAFKKAVEGADTKVEKVGLKLLAIDIGAYCVGENPRFDGDKFLKACGFEVIG